ncbi:uncharacterized protein [Nicotiana tomentosiformis]|uniref:uncharacterized protein n=1 Tax=Nicotiana tomentosiformis TaxID=4098 RepID=UPI00388C8B3B
MDILENIPGILEGSDIFSCAVNLVTQKEMRHAFIKLSTDEASLMACWNIDKLIFSHPSDLLNEKNEEEESQEDKEWMALFQIACKSILIYYEKYICKEPCRTSKHIGNIFIDEILHGNETRCYENFRQRKSVFLDLRKDLTDKYDLKPTREMSVYEELGMFLMICAHGTGNRIAGWERATHDNRIFGEALRRPELNFSYLSGDKYYLVDAGYSHMKGYMAPYKGDNVRYHFAEFYQGAIRQL